MNWLIVFTVFTTGTPQGITGEFKFHSARECIAQKEAYDEMARYLVWNDPTSETVVTVSKCHVKQ